MIAACEIVGSSDASIRNARVNDLSEILNGAPIERIFVNGKTAQRLYRRYAEPRDRPDGFYLIIPSLSRNYKKNLADRSPFGGGLQDFRLSFGQTAPE